MVYEAITRNHHVDHHRHYKPVLEPFSCSEDKRHADLHVSQLLSQRML